MKSETCLLCRNSQIAALLDFGPQPICNRFPASPDAPEDLFPMRLGLCPTCGTVQSLSPVSAGELRPRCDWITYNEPEGHLDHLADHLARLPGLSKDSIIGGISFKDDSLLRRLRERGFTRTWRVDPEGDLGISDSGAGVETIQDRLDCNAAARMAGVHGKCDLVLARHIWEHTTAPAEFLTALLELLNPAGYLLLEIPDCERSLANGDYSMVWEEHTLYFTPATFRQGILLSGLAIHHFDTFPYAFENSLVVVATRGNQSDPEKMLDPELAKEKQRAVSYAEGWASQREKIGRYFERYRKEQGKIAILGAGHLACTFINLLGLKEHIDCLVDDNPHKRGLFMPGSRLPIYGSEALIERDIRMCLLSVNAESEEKVIQKNRAFTEAGGIFHSIFPASQYALRV